MSRRISWWRTSFGEQEIERIGQSIRQECVSQGKVTAELERELGELLEVEHVIAASSGSSAIVMSLMAAGVVPGDEVILPNRTWIATAHAVHLLGAKVIPVDVQPGRPIIDADQIEKEITAKTKVIMPVHMNGRSADMVKIRKLANRYELVVIEDAAQGLASRNSNGYLGTQSDIGCFSLSVAKVISTGQGGFAVTSNGDLAGKLRMIRTHGVENVKDPKEWTVPGFNFRITDVHASIGLEQLKRLPERLDRLREIYRMYEEGLAGSPFRLIPVDLAGGEVPIYVECLVARRQHWIELLESEEIETRPFYPDIDKAPYFSTRCSNFPNSREFGLEGIYLPGGPSQERQDVRLTISRIRKLSESVRD